MVLRDEVSGSSLELTPACFGVQHLERNTWHEKLRFSLAHDREGPGQCPWQGCTSAGPSLRRALVLVLHLQQLYLRYLVAAARGEVVSAPHCLGAQADLCCTCLGCRDVCATCECIQVPPGASPLPLHIPASSTGLGRMGGLRAAVCPAPFCFPVLANRHPASPSESKAVFQPHSLLLLFLHFLVCLGTSLRAWCASSS